MDAWLRRLAWLAFCLGAVILVLAVGRIWLANGEGAGIRLPGSQLGVDQATEGAPETPQEGAQAMQTAMPAAGAAASAGTLATAPTTPGGRPVGTTLTNAPGVQAFWFALVADTHVRAGRDSDANRSVRTIFAALGKAAATAKDARDVPAFVMDLGDVTNTGDEGEYDTLNELLPPILSSRWRAVPGNHEVRWSRWGEQLFEQRWGAVPYSFDHGGIHFVGLDSTRILEESGYFGNQELAWLQADLARIDPRTPVILFFHHPVGSDFYFVGNQDAFFRVVAPYNVRAAFVGHIHQERTWTQNGIVFVSLPSAHDRAVYYRARVELQLPAAGTSAGGPSLSPTPAARLRVERVETGWSLWAGTSTIATVTLTGPRPADAARPLTVSLALPRPAVFPTSSAETLPASAQTQVQAGSDGLLLSTLPSVGAGTSPASVLEVTLPRSAPVADVSYQIDWPVFCSSAAGQWRALRQAKPAPQQQLWRGDVDLAGLSPGLHHVQVRVRLRSGEMWDSFVNFQLFPNPSALASGAPGAAGQVGGAVLAMATGSAPATEAARPWRYPVGAPVQAGLVLIPGRPQARLIVATTTGQLLALSATSGDRLWSFQAQGAIRGTPAISSDGSMVYVGAGGGWVYALSSLDGRLAWAQRTPEPVLGSPLWVGSAGAAGPQTPEDLLLVPAGRELLALAAHTGQLRWRQTLPGWVGGRPAVDEAHTTVYVGVGDGKALALDLATGAVRWQTAVGHGLLYGPWASQLVTVPDARGPGVSRTQGDPQHPYGLVLVGTVETLVALDGASGQPVWSVEGRYMYSEPALMPAPGREVVLVDERGRLVSVEAHSGRLLRQTDLGEPVFDAAPVWGGPEQPDLIYVQGVLGSVFVVDRESLQPVAAWRVSASSYVFATPAAGEGRLFTADMDGWVQALTVTGPPRVSG